jgi:dihydroorotate dehydrogenase
MSFIDLAYKLARPILFQLDAEKAHHFAIACLKRGLGPKRGNDYGAILRSTVCGITFPNPVGLAAGFDKNAEVIGEVLGFGFGFVELGSITPLPQSGNPKPRLFRVPSAKAVINRFGFNSDGIDRCQQRFAAYRDENIDPMHKAVRGIIGINIGKNKESVDAAKDYATGIRRFAPFADYITVNVSSPNTPGLRDLQSREQLGQLLDHVMTARNATDYKPPVFVKIAPDLSDEQQDDIAEAVLVSGVQGVIIGNTTTSRPSSIPPRLAAEAGGLSGQPLMAMSTLVLASMYRRTKGAIPLIGCGGVFTAEDAYAKIRAGASLVQLYSALVYEGPGLIPRINEGLAALLERDGFNNVSEAVGSGNK